MHSATTLVPYSFTSGSTAAKRSGSSVMELIIGRCLQRGSAAPQRFRVGAVQAQRQVDRFLHHVDQPGQALGLLAGDPAVHIQHVRPGLAPA